MSGKQRDFYVQFFPFLSTKDNIVLSSVFKEETLDNLKKLRTQRDNKNLDDLYVSLASPSWIKGYKETEKYCEENNLKMKPVWGFPHEIFLKILSESKGLIFLPLGKDTCPRIVIEAKLLGCDLILNDNVQHKDEPWFDTDNLEDIESFLRNNKEVFWKNIDAIKDKIPTLSGYTTTKDCIEQGYPFREAIKSMLNFCDQVVVVDGGSTDGTWEELKSMSAMQGDGRLIVEKRERDWNHKRFAVFDGLQKAYARSLCTGDWCWQMDSDEIVHENDYEKIKKLMKDIPKSVHLLALPVIEYWGGGEKVRIDINPWKWRLSRNHKHITHGIPSELRRIDSDGCLYSAPGSDGCDYIDAESYERIPCMHFYNQEIHDARMCALTGDVNSIEAYENWFNNLIENLPGVHHYSWYDLERKIKTYKNYWSTHWMSLYDIDQKDTPENNMFFDKSWSEVTDEEISNLAVELREKMGGWVFHKKIDFNEPTPHVYVERGEPKVMNNA